MKIMENRMKMEQMMKMDQKTKIIQQKIEMIAFSDYTEAYIG